VHAAVATGRLDDPRRSIYLESVLLARRRTILARYLSKLSPLADVALVGDELCATDLANFADVPGVYEYRARLGDAELAVHEEAAGRVCVGIPPGQGYRIVEIWNGQAKEPLRVHMIASRIVGIER
jgi:hypothetical protein